MADQIGGPEEPSTTDLPSGSDQPTPVTAADLQAGGKTPVVAKVRKRRWVADAMLLVRDHPDWSDAAIANEVDVNPSQLSRCSEYKMAAAMARGQKSDLPRGHWDEESERPEAYFDRCENE
jgi:hypothetical protein